MSPRYLRPLLIVEFLIALEAVFTFWSQAGGQYHLDLMFWPWKLGFGIGIPLLIVLITAELVRSDGAVNTKVRIRVIALIVAMTAAGIVTYYYHVNEPADEEPSDEQQTTITRTAAPSGQL